MLLQFKAPASTQLVHVVGAGENNPAAQLAHALELVPPPPADHAPAPQLTQLDAPATIAKAPAAQLVHSTALDAANAPAPQVKQTDDVAAAVDDEYSPAPHAVHVSPPIEAMYLPAPHPKHPLEPIAALKPAAQVEHTDDAVAPISPEYLPAAQQVHDAEPVALA